MVSRPSNLSCFDGIIKIADGQDDKRIETQYQLYLSDALSVSFNRNVGHDYLEDYEERYELYNKKKVEFNSTLNTLIRLRKEVYQQDAQYCTCRHWCR